MYSFSHLNEGERGFVSGKNNFWGERGGVLCREGEKKNGRSHTLAGNNIGEVKRKVISGRFPYEKKGKETSSPHVRVGKTHGRLYGEKEGGTS